MYEKLQGRAFALYLQLNAENKYAERKTTMMSGCVWIFLLLGRYSIRMNRKASSLNYTSVVFGCVSAFNLCL